MDTLFFHLDETKEGDSVEVPRWVGEILVETGFADAQEESLEIEISRALSRERIQGSLQLSTLKKDFYLKVRRHLNYLERKGEIDEAAKPEHERFSVSAYDLITLRLGKLLYFGSSSSTPQDLLEKITPEEEKLFNGAHDVVESWRKTVLEGAH